jgi:hypothetical protein
MLYPENIAIGLEQPEVSAMVTGKFVLEMAEDAEQDRQLTATVELIDPRTFPALGQRPNVRCSPPSRRSATLVAATRPTGNSAPPSTNLYRHSRARKKTVMLLFHKT